jgi:hypothetical protein
MARQYGGMPPYQWLPDFLVFLCTFDPFIGLGMSGTYGGVSPCDLSQTF